MVTHAQWIERAANLKFKTENFIDGEYRPAVEAGTFPVVNPATGAVIANVARGNVKDVNAAVESARRTFKSGVWSRMEPRERMDVLYRLAELIGRETETLSLLDTVSMGKPINDMLT